MKDIVKVMKLVEAGYTRDEINIMLPDIDDQPAKDQPAKDQPSKDQQKQDEQKPNAQPDPVAPSNATDIMAEYAKRLQNSLNEFTTKIQDAIHRVNIDSSEQPTTESADDVIAHIIAPPQK